MCKYSDYEMVKGGYKGTHQYSFKGSHKGKLPLIWLGGKTFKKTIVFSESFYRCNASTNPRSQLHGLNNYSFSVSTHSEMF